MGWKAENKIKIAYTKSEKKKHDLKVKVDIFDSKIL